MINEKILNKECVFFDSKAKTKDEAIDELSELGVKFNIVKDAKLLKDGFIKREEEFSTGLESGFAIPHAKIKEIKKPKIFIVRYKKSLEWGTFDNSKVEVVIALMIPEKSSAEHLALMSGISQRLLEEEVKQILKTSSDAERIIDVLTNKNESNLTEQNYEGYLIAITGCPAGVAHTYMAAKKIEDFAKEKNWKVKVEKQGAAGFEDKLTLEDVENANILLISADINPGEIERFKDIPTIKTSVAEPIHDMNKIWTKLMKEKRSVENQVLNNTKETTKKEKFNFKTAFRRQTKSLKNSILTGISFVVPIIVAGTTIVAIVTIINQIFGSENISENASWLNKLADVSGGALSILLAPVLAGYIAYAMADKPGLFPGFLSGLACNAVNYEKMVAGEATTIVSGLGFLGGLIAGIITGYLMIAAKKYLKSKKFQGVLTWFVYPVFGSLIVMSIILFVIGTPLALLISLIFDGLSKLQNTNVSFMAGLIVGMLCVIDLGGPFNKVAWAFSFASFTQAFDEQGTIVQNAALLAPYTAFWAAGIGTGWTTSIVSLVCRKIITQEEKEAGKISWIMSSLGITEGSIPMMLADPFRVIPSFMVGGAVSGALSYAVNLGSTITGGGFITVAGVTSTTGAMSVGIAILVFILIALLGTAISTGMIVGLKLMHLNPKVEAKVGRVLAQIFTLGLINIKFKKEKTLQKD